MAFLFFLLLLVLGIVNLDSFKRNFPRSIRNSPLFVVDDFLQSSLGTIVGQSLPIAVGIYILTSQDRNLKESLSAQDKNQKELLSAQDKNLKESLSNLEKILATQDKNLKEFLIKETELWNVKFDNLVSIVKQNLQEKK